MFGQTEKLINSSNSNVDDTLLSSNVDDKTRFVLSKVKVQYVSFFQILIPGKFVPACTKSFSSICQSDPNMPMPTICFEDVPFIPCPVLERWIQFQWYILQVVSYHDMLCLSHHEFKYKTCTFRILCAYHSMTFSIHMTINQRLTEMKCPPWYLYMFHYLTIFYFTLCVWFT